jgi:hypothetical protein
MSEPDHSRDYVWHFKLCEDAETPAGGDEGLTEMVRQQISALLACVQFTSEGRDVRVTGFRFLDDPSREHHIRSSLADGGPLDSA